mgnify:CR=1 FL=1
MDKKEKVMLFWHDDSNGRYPMRATPAEDKATLMRWAKEFSKEEKARKKKAVFPARVGVFLR